MNLLEHKTKKRKRKHKTEEDNESFLHYAVIFSGKTLLCSWASMGENLLTQNKLRKPFIRVYGKTEQI